MSTYQSEQIRLTELAVLIDAHIALYPNAINELKTKWGTK